MASEDHTHVVSTEGMRPGENTVAQCNNTGCKEEIIVQVPAEQPENSPHE